MWLLYTHCPLSFNDAAYLLPPTTLHLSPPKLSMSMCSDNIQRTSASQNVIYLKSSRGTALFLFILDCCEGCTSSIHLVDLGSRIFFSCMDLHIFLGSFFKVFSKVSLRFMKDLTELGLGGRGGIVRSCATLS